MRILNSNTQAQLNFLAAADDIMDLMDNLGFTSEIQSDPEMIRQTVAQIIRQNIEGNTTYTSYDLGVGVMKNQYHSHDDLMTTAPIMCINPENNQYE